jgi:hypothetical protein
MHTYRIVTLTTSSKGEIDSVINGTAMRLPEIHA